MVDGNAIYTGLQNAWAGFEIVGVGDVNADGYDELFIRAPSELKISRGSDSNIITDEETIGEAHLIYGKEGNWTETSAGLSGDVIYTSGQGGDAFSNKVARLGDINNDGNDDFAIASTVPGETIGSSSLGFVFIIMDHLSNSDSLVVSTNSETQPVTSNISIPSDKSNSNDSSINIFPTTYAVFILLIFRIRKRL